MGEAGHNSRDFASRGGLGAWIFRRGGYRIDTMAAMRREPFDETRGEWLIFDR
jgi:hypothetical protein